MLFQVWPEGEACPTLARVRQQVRATLSALQTDYLDLCLLPANPDAHAFQVCACIACPPGHFIPL